MRKIILGILLLLSLGYAIYTYYPYVKLYLPKAKGVLQIAVPRMALPPPPEVEVPQVEIPKKIKVRKLVDPFALRIAVREKVTKTPEKAPTKLKLEGIWVDAKMRVAFVSGQALRVGDKVLGWRVTSITSKRVVIEKGSETKILRMEER